MLLKFNLILLSFLLPPTIYVRSETIIFSDINKKVEIGGMVDILEDPASSISYSEALSSKKFKKSNLSVPNLGISSSSFWIKFQIKNTTSENTLLLEFAQATIDSIEFYTIDSNGKEYMEKTGEAFPYFSRQYNSPNFIFKLTIPKGETKTYLIKVRNGQQIQIPLTLGTSIVIFDSVNNKDSIFGVYFGIILVMFLYNLFIYFTVRDRSYLFYVLYILSVGLTQASINGYTFKFLWPNSPWLANQSLVLAPVIAGITAIEFAKVFMRVKEYFSFYIKGFHILSVLYIICGVINILGLYNIGQQFVQIIAILVSIYLLFVAFKISKKGYRPATFFFIAWLIFLVGVCLFILKDIGILPYNNFTYYTMQIGSALEVILLSLALADRIKVLQKEKEESQAQTLAALQENERIIRERNKILDQQVKKRTVELESSNKNLEKALRELQDTQTQLVSSEKMASLGLLTAGMAHEINNPINFVISSVNPLRRDFNELLQVIQKYEEVDESNFKEKTKEIKDYKEDLDLEYIKEEIESLIQGIGDGANRTADIVKGLKTFSRIDETDLKRVDLNEGIDSTLILLTSLMNNRITIEKNYENAESVECYAGKINQVFMNILSNAIYAINKKGLADGEGKITINTREKGDNVIITIKDNGVGMPEEIKAKIFDPFFTTKDVGEGTGLGLSITYNIIESHNGKIDVISETGKGAEFIITLPKLQESK